MVNSRSFLGPVAGRVEMWDKANLFRGWKTRPSSSAIESLREPKSVASVDRGGI